MVLSKLYNCPGTCKEKHYPLIPPGTRSPSKLQQLFFDYLKANIQELLSSKPYSRDLLIQHPTLPGAMTTRKMSDKEYRNKDFEKTVGALWGFGCCCGQHYVGLQEKGDESPAAPFLRNGEKIYHFQDWNSCGDQVLHFLQMGHHPVADSLRIYFLCEKQILKDAKFNTRLLFKNDLMVLQFMTTTRTFDLNGREIVKSFFAAEYGIPSTQAKIMDDFVTYQEMQSPTDVKSFNWGKFLTENAVGLDTSPGDKYLTESKTKSSSPVKSEERRKKKSQKETHRMIYRRQVWSFLYENRSKMVKEDFKMVSKRYAQTCQKKNCATKWVSGTNWKSNKPSKVIQMIRQAITDAGVALARGKIMKWIKEHYPKLNMEYLEPLVHGHITEGVKGKNPIFLSTRKNENARITAVTPFDAQKTIEVSNKIVGIPEKAKNNGKTSASSSTSSSKLDSNKKSVAPLSSPSSSKLVDSNNSTKLDKELSTGSLLSKTLIGLGGRRGSTIDELKRSLLQNNAEIELDKLEPPMDKWLKDNQGGYITCYRILGQEPTYKYNMSTPILDESDDDDFS